QQGALDVAATVAGLVVDERLVLLGQPAQGATLVLDDLAEEQVLALDRRRALVQGVDLGVADVLLERVLLQEARAAERLQRLGAQQDPRALRAVALDQRQQQVVDGRRQAAVLAR